MKKIILIIFIVLQLHATDSFNSEVSHFAGGAVLAGATTAIVDQFPEYKQNRFLIAFSISAAIGTVDQTIQYIEDGGIKGQLLDLSFHVLGSALGAWITDKYILSPVIIDSKTEGKYMGVKVAYSF